MKLLKLIPDNTNIKFLRWRVPFYAISLLLMAASLALVFTQGLNLGVDFAGGQSTRVTFAEKTAPIARVRTDCPPTKSTPRLSPLVNTSARLAAISSRLTA